MGLGYRILSFLLIAAVSVVVALMLLSLPVGVYIVFISYNGTKALTTEMTKPSLFIAGAPVQLPISVTIGGVFIVILTAYAALLVTAARGPMFSILHIVSSVFTKDSSIIRGNTLFTTASAFSSLLVATIALEYLQESAGIYTGSLPEVDPIVQFISISTAPIVEEIGFRATIIGFAAFFLATARAGWRQGLGAIWHPEKYVEGRPAEMKLLDIIVVASGLFFGLSHILYGGGWQIGKVSQAALAGIALGWIYVRYGLPGAILLHWSFNYFISTYYYLSEVTDGPNITPLVNVSVIVAGILTSLTMVLWFINKVRSKRRESSDSAKIGNSDTSRVHVAMHSLAQEASKDV